MFHCTPLFSSWRTWREKAVQDRNTLPDQVDMGGVPGKRRPRKGAGKAEAIFSLRCHLLTAIGVSGRRRTGPLDHVPSLAFQELLADEWLFSVRKNAPSR